MYSTSKINCMSISVGCESGGTLYPFARRTPFNGAYLTAVGHSTVFTILSTDEIALSINTMQIVLCTYNMFKFIK